MQQIASHGEDRKTAKQMDEVELMNCINTALDRFGTGIKYSVYWRMVAAGESPREGIAAKPEAFVKALRSIFGRGASRQIETAVMDEIKSRTDSSYSDIENMPELIATVRKQSVLASPLAVTIQ